MSLLLYITRYILKLIIFRKRELRNHKNKETCSKHKRNELTCKCLKESRNSRLSFILFISYTDLCKTFQNLKALVVCVTFLVRNSNFQKQKLFYQTRSLQFQKVWPLGKGEIYVIWYWGKRKELHQGLISTSFFASE